ncbi:NAD-dependent epimerase/dehydratase family protein [Pelagibaculum spongiae]|uniref:Oxidoreductase n=1 Tax=Pelagibaculum spongiae TaxID=2080658 RepID=A0A2V1GU69_9GAMM|nr:NAD-dependent epimerase/dehydratase family protein [Pelagibaculum spongiae]PVZ68207.1 oxidoreductase [Pelagibaculum spongiae]
MSKTALIVGATGAVGSQLLPLLLQSDHYSRVIYLGRSRLQGSLADNEKLEQHILPIADWQNFSSQQTIDLTFCCLGTTLKQAGSKPAFKAVDLDAVQALAQIVRQKNHCSHFSVISSSGAGGKLPGFYLQIKTEMERQLSQRGFKTLQIFRPSLLNRQKSQQDADFRLGESLALMLFKLINPLIPKQLTPVTASSVAKAMLDAADNASEGVTVIQRNQMD